MWVKEDETSTIAERLHSDGIIDAPKGQNLLPLLYLLELQKAEHPYDENTLKSHRTMMES